MSEFVNTIDLFGDEVVVGKFIDGTLTELNDDTVETVGTWAFAYLSNLVSVNLPAVKTTNSLSFYFCSNLLNVELDSVTYIESETFRDCKNLKTLDLPLCTKIMNGAFKGCASLDTLILRSDVMCIANWPDIFSSSPENGQTKIASGTGYIYVPSSLVTSYQSDSKWSTWSSQFRALEDFTVDGTITGELDPTKI